jgi:hypothetical protein
MRSRRTTCDRRLYGLPQDAGGPAPCSLRRIATPFRCTPGEPPRGWTPDKLLIWFREPDDYEQVGRAFESAGFPPKVITKPPAHTRIVVAGARRAVDCRKSDSVLRCQLPRPERTGSWRSRLGAGTSGDGVEGRLQDLPPRHRNPVQSHLQGTEVDRLARGTIRTATRSSGRRGWRGGPGTGTRRRRRRPPAR